MKLDRDEYTDKQSFCHSGCTWFLCDCIFHYVTIKFVIFNQTNFEQINFEIVNLCAEYISKLNIVEIRNSTAKHNL